MPSLGNQMPQILPSGIGTAVRGVDLGSKRKELGIGMNGIVTDGALEERKKSGLSTTTASFR